MTPATVSMLSGKTYIPEEQEDQHRFRLGMPNLTFSGLSENWLLRTSGDVHWQAICGSCGLGSQDIVDATGRRLYPSFVEVLLHGDPLASFTENDHVTLRPRVRSMSRRGVWSRQHVDSANQGASVCVEMLTIFVRRSEAGGTNTGLKFRIPGVRLNLPKYDSAVDHAAIAGPRRVAPQAADDPDPSGFRAYLDGSTRVFEHTPCPAVDFNGAQLLYFANYQEIVDRAEWSFFADWPIESFSTTRRHIRYLGNVDARDPVHVRLEKACLSETTIRHEAVMTRASDGRAIAQITTEKRRV